MGEEAGLVRLRFERGCRAFTVHHSGDVVGYGWLSSRPEWIGELGLEITPGDGEAYVWNCVTLPPHRLRGVFRALLCHVVALARREGLRRLWIGSVDGGAERALVATGFAPIVRFRVANLGQVRCLALSRPVDVLSGKGRFRIFRVRNRRH
jgi:GNAT superfamily N-acetyltransferase